MSNWKNTIQGKLIIFILMFVFFGFVLVLSLNLLLDAHISHNFKTYIGANGLIRLLVFTAMSARKPRDLTVADYLHEDDGETEIS